MKTLKALQPLTGDYGHVAPGEVFKAEDDVAELLIERELAEATAEPVGDVEGNADTDDDDKTAHDKAAGAIVEDKSTTDMKDEAGAKKKVDKVDKGANDKLTKEDKDANSEATKEDKGVSTEDVK